MTKKMDDQAVAEVVGAVLLLAMAVAFFSVIYLQVLSDEGPVEKPFVTVVGTTEFNTVVFEHNRGERISTDSIVTLLLAGQDEIVNTVGDLLDDTGKQNGIWNIGEKLVYMPEQDLEDVQIKATIVEKESNALVFWGTLQEGYIIPPFGRGGLWHFNESYWDGTPGEVIDSSGNENHGTAHNGANTTDDVVSPLANRSGIFNIIDDDDYVEVPDAYSLDITEHITIEAWVKPFLDSAGTIDLLDQFGYTPYIANVIGNKYVFVVVSEDQSQEGVIQTVNITPHRKLSEDSIIDINYDLAEGHTPLDIRPIITHASDNIYVVAYNNKSVSKNTSVYLKTFNISSNGSIEFTENQIFDDRDSNIGKPNRPSIVKVSDFDSYSIFAIAYGINVNKTTHPSVGIIRTINISHDGNIKYTGETATFDDVEGYGPSIIHVAGDTFALTYRNASNVGIVKTFNISSNGSINYTGKKLIFDNIINNEFNPPSIVKVNDFESYSVFAIAYGVYIDHANPAVGIIKTLNIFSNGTIKITGFDETFEVLSCYNPHIIHHSEDYYIVSYDTEPWANSEGKFVTIQIRNNGNINYIGPIETFDENRCHNPIAIKISERAFAIVYESIAGGSGHPGYLATFQIEYPSDFYSRGINKLGSYGIYSNPATVYASINNKTINASITPNAWNFVVLTYDRNQMKLYINGILKTTKDLTEAIKITDSNLIFGDLFYGLIDEVAIYDRALSYLEVQDHFKQYAPIIISNVNTSEINYNSAKITWDTNVDGTSIVRYGTTTPPTNTVSNVTMVTNHSILLESLLSKTTYYYEVESTDQDGNTVIDNNGGRYYSFKTQNTPPNVPRAPKPTNGRKNVKTTTILSWIGGDDDGDDVFYDVYLDTINPPITIVSANQSAQIYDPDPDLSSSTAYYYWKIIAWDSYGDSTAGPIWYFSTKK